MTMQQVRFTLAEATGWPLEELLNVTPIDCLDFTPAQAKATAAAWAWLLGLSPGDGPAYEAARDEALSDGDIFVAVNLAPLEFFNWFRRLEWDDFPRTDNEGYDWAWSVLERARRAMKDGFSHATARQLSIAELVARSGGFQVNR